MTMTQVDELLSVVAELGRKRRLDEWDVTRAQSIAWLLASRCAKQFPAHYWAHLAIRRVRCGRDLPGCETSETDVLRSRKTWLCGVMGDVKDPSPGPAAQAAHREQWQRLEAALTPQEGNVARLALEGLSGVEIAERLGRTQGRVSQLRRQAAGRWTG